MDKSLKRTLLALFVAGILICACALVVSYVVMSSPERVTAAAQSQMNQYFGIPVSIAGSSIDLKKGPRVVLTSVHMESPGELSLQVKKVYAYLSIWHLLFGDVKVTQVRLSEPVATLNLESLKKLKPKGKPAERPVLVIRQGSLRLLYKDKELDLKEVNGRIKDERADLRARTLGGRVLLEADLVKPGKAAFEAYDIHLDRLGKGFKGTFRMSLTMENEPTGYSGSFLLETKGLGLPWTKDGIDKLTASITASGIKDRVNLTDISLKTPLVEVSGKGVLLGTIDESSWPEANLTLDLSSTDFDYEQVVAMLPMDLFPEWLKTLLTSQIRNGRSRFSTAQYRGPLKGFFNGETLMDNLNVVQDLNGQSFGAGYGPERITGITGKVIYGAGDIKFIDLSGMMGKSRLDRVNITLPKVVDTFMRVSVDVDIDMPASDFIRTWRASMVPENVYKLLSPISKVKAGRVRAQVSTSYDETSGKPPQSKGDIRLTGCTFVWGSHTIMGQSGTIHSDAFSSPKHVVMSAQLDSVHISKLDMSLSDSEPFGKNRYKFILLADRLSMSTLTISDASLTLIASGEGPNLKGTFDVRAPGLSILDSQFQPSAKTASARGELKAILWPQSRFDLTGVDVRMTSGRLIGSAHIEGDAGSASLAGDVRLDEIVTTGSRGTQSLGGLMSGTLILAWGKTFSMDGHLSMNEAVLPYRDRLLRMNGSLIMNSSIISSEAFRITSTDSTIVLIGSLALDKPLQYKGKLVISGLKLGNGGTSIGEVPKDLNADASLTITNSDLYGIPIENARATASLKQGVMDLSAIEIEAMSGSAKGTASIAIGGTSSFDFVISARNADMRKLLRAASPGKWWIDGDLDLEGHLFGNTDSINGTLLLNARNGEIRNYALTTQIFSLLNVYKIMKTQDIDFLSSHFTYNYLSSTITIKDGILSFDDFSLDSNSLQLSAVGTYSLKTQKVDAVLGVQPLESVDKTVSMIPLIGWVLTGDKGEMIVVSMKVKGPFDNPSVQVAPVTTLSNTVAASLLRALKLPDHLINESMKMIHKKN